MENRGGPALVLVVLAGLFLAFFFFASYSNFITGNAIGELVETEEGPAIPDEPLQVGLLGEYGVAPINVGEILDTLLGKEEQEEEQEDAPAPIGAGALTTNSVLLKPKADVSTYPVQIGRIFKKGEIVKYPQVLADGTAIDTQADVKTRWSDGSVQHAVLSFYVTGLQKDDPVTLTFQNQETGRNTGEVKASDVKSNPNPYNFAASMTIASGGTTRSAFAGTMLADDNYQYWIKGDQATTFILADHSTTRKYDIGFDSHNALRPIFHVTFFPKTKQTRVRYIGEISNPDKQKNMNYRLELTIHKDGISAYTKNGVNHNAGGRWTKEFWMDDRGLITLPVVEIDHNLAYLKDAGFFPNFDTSLVMPESSISAKYTKWIGTSRDLFENGQWVKDMGTPGGRHELAPFPGWTTWWLYSGDARMKEVAFGQADLAAAWPMHYRESQSKSQNSRRVFDDIGTDALGKPVSPRARPTLWIFTDSNRQFGSASGAADRFVDVGNNINYDRWKPDCQHLPDPYSAQYALSGDFWYYEQLHFWASWISFFGHPSTNNHNGRGPTGAEGGFWDLSRGMGWCGRERARLAFLAPDSHPEKALYTELTNEMLAIWEGSVNITGHFQDNPKYSAEWKWGNDINLLAKGVYEGYGKDANGKPLGPPPLGNIGRVHGGINTEHAKADSLLVSPWMENILIYALGNMKELGFESEPLLARQGSFLIGQITQDPAKYDPYLSGQYRFPVKRVSNGVFYTSFEEAKSHYQPARLTGAKDYFLGTMRDTNFGYGWIAFAASSYVPHLPKGQTTYSWFTKEFYEQSLGGRTAKSYAADNPAWTIIPRASQANLPRIDALRLSANAPEVTRVSNQQSNGILVFGSNFDTDAVVLIDGKTDSRLNSQRRNDQLMLFTIPKNYPTGDYRINVRSSGSLSNNKFLKVWDGIAPPTLESITPSEIFNDVDKKVTLTGTNFGTKPRPIVAGSRWHEHTVIKVGGKDTITLDFPAGSGIGNHQVSVEVNGTNSNTQQLLIRPYVQSIAPTSIINNQKQTITVTGGTYNQNTKVYLGGFEKTRTDNKQNPRQITFETSVGEATGSRAVIVAEGTITSNNNHQLTITAPAFNYALSLNSSSDSVAQGKQIDMLVTIQKTVAASTGTVTLKDSNADPNISTSFTPSRCTFTTNQNTCTATMRILAGPRTSTGAKALTITATSGKGIIKTAPYTLTVTQMKLPDAPVLNRIIPNKISNKVNTDVSFEGVNFTELAALRVGPVLLDIANTVPINDTLVRFLATTTLPAGSYPVQVTNVDGKLSNPLTLTIDTSATTQKVLDTDLDGIPNAKDKCPRTPSKLHAKSRGTESGCPLPSYGTLTRTITTNFANITDPHKIKNLKLGLLNRALITFTKDTSLATYKANFLRFEAVDLPNNIKLEKNKVSVDSVNLPGLNVSADITFFNSSLKNPVPFSGEARCTKCTVTSYDAETTNVQLSVPYWSEYEIKEGSCGDGYCSITESQTSCSADCGTPPKKSGSGGGGGGGGGGGSSDDEIVVLNLNDGKNHSTSISTGTKIDLKVDAKVYRIEVTKIVGSLPTIKFVNISRFLNLEQFRNYLVDLDLSGDEDIELYILKNGAKYTLVAKKVLDSIQNNEETGNKEKPGSTKKPQIEVPDVFRPSKAGFWVLITGVLVVVLGIYLMFRDRKGF